MARPGTQVTILDSPPPRSAPTDTGVWFVAGTSEKGPDDRPVEVTSLTQFVEEFGPRVSYSVLYDALDTYFREGGSRAVISRVVGPAPVKAGVVLNDAGAAATLRVQAKTPGAYGNSFNIAVIAGDAGGEFKLVLTHDTDTSINETSPSFADKAAALAWVAGHDHIEFVDQASVNDPAVVAAQNFAGGTDDRANIADAHWLAALNRIPSDLGPGQVSAPGRVTTVGHQQLVDHAQARNRRAILDVADGASKATMISALAALRTYANGEFGAVFGPWVDVPGVLAGTTRAVPYSAVQAGLIARSDGLGNSPNAPAAGQNGQAQFALGVRTTFSDDDREDLNEVGMNIAVEKYGGVRTYGYRTPADSSLNPNWVEFSNSRYFMSVVARGDSIAERFVFREIDGRGITINDFGGQLTGMLAEDWAKWGSLYGATPEEAFNVDVGPQVNTPESIQNRELKARLALRMSPFAELVILEIAKVRVTEAVA